MTTTTKIMMKLFSHFHFRAGLRAVFVGATSRSLLLKNFSTLAESNADAPLQRGFAVFANAKFNLSSTNIAHVFKLAPQLERLKTLQNVEQVVAMLNRHGCTDHQIAKIMTTYPKLLTFSVERITEPKVQVLKDFGFQGENLAKLLTVFPYILGVSLDRELVPKLTLLKNIFQSENLLIKAVLKDPVVLICNLEKTMKPSLACWEAHGFRGTELAKFLFIKPRVLLCSSLPPAKIDLIHKIGVDKRSKMYRYVVSLVTVCRIETLEDKMHNFQLCGLTVEETLKLFRVSPYILCLSKEKVSQHMDFIVNNLELPANSVLQHKKLLEKSLERTIKPRLLVWKKLKSTNGDGYSKVKSLSTILNMTEANFVNKIIKSHPESTTLYTIYEDAVANVSGRTKIPKSRKA